MQVESVMVTHSSVGTAVQLGGVGEETGSQATTQFVNIFYKGDNRRQHL